MVAVLRQAARSNFTNFGVSFYLRWMCYTKANNANREFSMSSRAAQRDSASQYLSQVLVDKNVLNQGITTLTQHLTSVYNFGAVSPFCENSSSRPAPCFLLSEQTKRYAVLVVPEAKTDAKFVHHLASAEASLKVWSYVIMRWELVPKPYSDLNTRYGNLVA